MLDIESTARACRVADTALQMCDEMLGALTYMPTQKQDQVAATVMPLGTEGVHAVTCADLRRDARRTRECDEAEL